MGCISSSAQQEPAPPRASWIHPQPMDHASVITRHFMGLDQFGKVQVEYVWIDSDYLDHKGMSFDFCSKAMTVDNKPESVTDLPVWNYGGDGGLDVKLVPRKIYKDPFRTGDNILALCDTYIEPARGSDDEYGPATEFNSRAACAAVMKKAADIGDDPWFGIEQEYYLIDAYEDKPLGWPDTFSRPDEGECFYCQVGATKCVGRDIVEAHYRACIHAGVKIGGINSEEEPSQWEFQVGPCSGIDCADDMWMARYILQRICELYNCRLSYDPKPVPGRAGIGCHTNYSSKATRTAPGGMKAMEKQIEHLRARHDDHMKVYGKDNERRMTGKDHTAKMSDFSWGIGDRFVSIRINVKCERKDCGFYEDRRPAANMDPYLVTQAIVETTLFFEETMAKKSDLANGLKEMEKPTTVEAVMRRSRRGSKKTS